MSTPDYNDLDQLIGRLKRSAIDAWMHEAGFKVCPDSYLVSRTESGPWNTPPITSTTAVVRPDGAGNGGGATTVITGVVKTPSPGYGDRFDAIRGEIDGLVDRWRGLPDPGRIDAVLHDWSSVRSVLAVSAEYQSGQVSGSGAIASNMALILQNAASLTGATGEAFKAQFLYRIGAVVGGLWALSLMASAAVAAQEGLWERARSAVAAAVDGARAAMDAVAESTSDKGHDVPLAILSAALSAAATLIGGEAAVAITVAGTGIDLLGKVTADQDATATISGSSERAAMDSLKSALDELAEQITTTERAVAANITDNLKTVNDMGRKIRHPDAGTSNSQSDPFDLAVPAISSTAQLEIESYGHVEGIYRTELPTIAEELDKAAKAVVGIHTYDPLRRNPSIGISPTGASDQHCDATWLMYKIAIDLAWDVREGAKNLEAALEAFKYHDREHADALTRIAAEVQGGSPTVDPWS